MEQELKSFTQSDTDFDRWVKTLNLLNINYETGFILSRESRTEKILLKDEFVICGESGSISILFDEDHKFSKFDIDTYGCIMDDELIVCNILAERNIDFAQDTSRSNKYSVIWVSDDLVDRIPGNDLYFEFYKEDDSDGHHKGDFVDICEKPTRKITYMHPHVITRITEDSTIVGAE